MSKNTQSIFGSYSPKKNVKNKLDNSTEQRSVKNSNSLPAKQEMTQTKKTTTTTRTGFTNSNRQRNLTDVGEGKNFQVKKKSVLETTPAKTTKSVLEEAFKPTGSVREANSTSSKSKVTGSVRNATSSKPSGTVRDAGTSQKKGSWNAEEEMRKRREAAIAKKRG